MMTQYFFRIAFHILWKNCRNSQNKSEKINLLQVMIKTIGTSVLKNNLYMIMIGEDIKQKERKYRLIPKFIDNKPSIIIMARQHPGQTPGSFVCQGFVKGLLQNTAQNRFLLNRFNFFIFPMINVDGVINGNYRGNAYGFDLNRVWKYQKVELHPQIFYVKSQIKKIAKRSNIHLILDFHGHSKKLNSFFFGNKDEKDQNRTQIFPLMASKASPHISFKNSTFSQDQDKQNAARLVLKNELKSHKDCLIYTFEASFYGTIKNGRKVHFTMQNYRNMGITLLQTLYKKQSQSFKEIKTLKESTVLKEINKQLDKLNKLNQGDNEKKNEGSDSEAEIYDEQFFILNNFNSQTEQMKLKQKNQELNTLENNAQKNLANVQIKDQLIYNMKQYKSQQKEQKNNLGFAKQSSPLQRQYQDDMKTYNSEKKSPEGFNRVKKQIQRRTNYFSKTDKITVYEAQRRKANQLKFKELSLIKSNSRNQIYDETIHNMLKLNKNLEPELSFPKKQSNKLQTIYNPKSLTMKDRDFYLYNIAINQKIKKREMLQKTNYWIQRQRRNTLDQDNVDQMIKIRKINYRIKACTSCFREEFIVQKDKN